MISAARFEYRGASSDKFYQVFGGEQLTVVHWGRNGTRGSFKADPTSPGFHQIASDRKWVRGYDTVVEEVRLEPDHHWAAISDAAHAGETPSRAHFDGLVELWVGALTSRWAQRTVALSPVEPTTGDAVAVLMRDWARTAKVRADLTGVIAQLGDPVAYDQHTDRALFALNDGAALQDVWPHGVVPAVVGRFDEAAATVALGLLDTFPGSVPEQLNAALDAARLLTDATG